ncbi:E3 ubiquitin-protein ligase MYCBP2-like [Diadema antillarum]|uniref:E3 ubiquitin-protein ligase MYCBP2-like n=1 Tax=Diadema antillarum TaxID=105358 RepID=UPI003A84CE05
MASSSGIGVGKHETTIDTVQVGRKEKGFRSQGFLTGRDSAKAVFHDLYAATADEHAGKKLPANQKKKKKTDGKGNDQKQSKEVSLENISFQPPNIELPDNASAFSIYAAVRQCILERETRERAIILSRASDGRTEDGNGDGDAEKEDKVIPLSKMVGLGLRSVFELIRQTRASHPAFCVKALGALLDILQGQTPEGLSREPDDILGALFELLMDLATTSAEEDEHSLATLSSACLLSLMVAMGNTGKLLTGISALLMIAGQRPLKSLEVPAIIVALQRSVHALLVGKTVFPNWLTLGVPSQSLIDTWTIHGLSVEASNPTGFSAIASDGRYLYIHGDKGLMKIGSGYSGTIKGHIYASNPTVYSGEKGWLGFSRNQLLFKCQEGTQAARNLLVKISSTDLKEEGQLALPPLACSDSGLFFSDGVSLGVLSSVTDDTFVVQTLGSLSAFSVGVGGELQAKLARKCLLAYGDPMPGGDKDSKDPEEIDPGVNEEVTMVGAGKEFSILRSNSGKIYFMGKSQSLGIKQLVSQGVSRWSELPISRSPSIVQCSIGHDGHHVVMLTDEGCTYFAGTARKGEDGDQVKGRRQMKPSKPVKMLRLDGKYAVHSACNNGSTAVVTREGELYLFGKDVQNTEASTGLVTDLKGVPIKEVALGKAHVCALTTSGQLYTFGISNKGQCGRGALPGQPAKDGAMAEGAAIATEEDVEEEEVEKEEEPCQHEWVTDQCMMCTSCGECTGYGASCIRSQRPGRRPGMICGCGSGDAGCRKCGICAACSGEGGGAGANNVQGNNGRRGGNIVMMGNGAPNDWLGHLRDAFIRRKVHHRQLDWVLGKEKAKDEGSNSGDDKEPERDFGKHVIHPPGQVTIGTGQSPVKQVTCGLHHSVVLLENGEAYTFGLGNHGQLGQRDSANRATPVKVGVDEKITQVAAGSNHTVLLSEGGTVFTCGSFQKGQLCRPVQEENNAAGAMSHTVPAPIPSLGARHSKRATWVGASGDHTFIKVDEALISPKMLADSLVFASQEEIGILPNDETITSVKCLMLNRKDGACTSFTGVDQSQLRGCSICLDPLYNVLWSYNPLLHQIQCYNILKTGITCPSILPNTPPAASILSPQLALPSTPHVPMEGAHIALHVLACLDSLTASREAGLTIVESEAQVQSVAKVYTKDDFSIVNRFEGYGGGWGYSGHSVEAVRFCPDTDVLLGGFGLFGGRGEYSAKIKVYDLGPKGGEYELDGELLGESDDITFDCGAREKFPILFEDPVPLVAGNWYVAWARVNGPSSDCGSNGQGTVTSEDQVSFQFMSSKKSNNGTDINAGQIPQILYRLPQPDSNNFRGKKIQGDPVHILSSAFSSSVSPEVFESLLKLLKWSWRMFRQSVGEALGLRDGQQTAARGELDRLVYIATACLRLLRSHVCEIYPNPATGKKPASGSSQLPECISMTCDLLKQILGELSDQRLCPIAGEDGGALAAPPPTDAPLSCHPLGRVVSSLMDECHHTFVQCFHAFYPTPQLKWVFLCDLLNSTDGSAGEVVSILNNLADVDDDALEEAQESDNAPNVATQSLESVLLNLNVSANETFQNVEPNIAVQVLSLSSPKAKTGLVFGSFGDVSAALTESNVKQLAIDEFEETPVDVVQVAAIVIPPEVLSHGKDGNIALTVYHDDSLFVQRENTSEPFVVPSNRGDTGQKFFRQINTNVIAASFGEQAGTSRSLDTPVTIVLTHKKNASNPRCVFWNYTDNSWSTAGCTLKNTSSEARSECECNHLTNFAVLMDIHAGSWVGTTVDKVYEILTYVGCAFSIFGLMVTLATYLSNRKLRQSQPNRILMCLCGTLLSLYVLFIIMSLVDGHLKTKAGVCGLVAGLVHFSMLSAVAWMGVEGVNMFYLLVRVVNSYIPRFMLKAGVVAWGVPALIVILTGAIAKKKYISKHFCFLGRWSMVSGLMVPMGIILLVNMVIFVMVIYRLTRTNIATRARSSGKEDGYRDVLRRCQNAVSIFLLLGLTWVLGYFTLIRDDNLVIHVLFVILNSLQGFFIFVLYCLRQQHFRDRMGRYRESLRRRFPRLVRRVNLSAPCLSSSRKSYDVVFTHSQSAVNTQSTIPSGTYDSKEQYAMTEKGNTYCI